MSLYVCVIYFLDLQLPVGQAALSFIFEKQLLPFRKKHLNVSRLFTFMCSQTSSALIVHNILFFPAAVLLKGH